MSIYFEHNKKTNLPDSAHERQEFGLGKKPLIMCPDCEIVYYDKSWHHKMENFKSLEKEKDFEITFKLCPACEMIKNHQYEGRVRIYSIPENVKKELGKLIVAYCRRAFEMDPLDRLIEIKKSEEAWEVTLTENQLANKVGNKIKDVFDKVEIRTWFAAEPSDVAEVVIEFQ